MRSTNRFLVLLSAAALLSTMLLSTVGAGVAFAATYSSPAHVTTTGDNTLNWTGQGTTDGEVNSAQCSGDTPNPGDLLWIFTTDGYDLGLPNPILTVNGHTYTGTNNGGSWHFVTHNESPDPALTTASVEFNVTTVGGGSLVLTISHGCPGGAAIANIVTAVHDASHNDITGTAVDLGSTVHDSATLTWAPTTADVPAGSTVTFYFFTGTPDTLEGPCTADAVNAADSEAFTLDGTQSTPYGIDPALAQGPLGPGNYFFFAQFVSADTDVMTHATSPCEPFTVNKGDLTISTDIHDAGHAIVTSVPLGSVVHDTATLTGAVAGFAPDLSQVSFTFATNGTCTDGVTVANGTPEGSLARSVDSAPLGAGSYSYNASFAGDDNYNPVGPSACEPLTVNKGDLTISTDIHDASHAIVTSVLPGSVVHDTATLTGAVAGFAPDLSQVSFTFATNGTCTDGATVANGTPEGSLARSVDSAPLDAGSYSYNASFAGDDNYNPVGPSACEPLAVFQPGKTMGFWGNKNGIARILGNGGYAANAVNIGRGAVIDTQAESLKVLPKTLNACGKGSPIIFTGQTVSTSCSLADGINVNSLNTLAAQTLALGYNIKLVAGYTGQTLADLGCTPVGSLTASSTVNDAFAAAVALINGSASGGTTTQAQIGAMNTLLGCLNSEG